MQILFLICQAYSSAQTVGVCRIHCYNTTGMNDIKIFSIASTCRTNVASNILIPSRVLSFSPLLAAEA